ncbi:MAG: T9SS type A sorting domain-containing protein, partial [Bacteroidetes bacterium]|nr:T9SS type A sorting domain-containing protein [Bacteroidota bacterium]
FCIKALYNYEWCKESPKECVTYHVSVNEFMNNTVKIYPNPANSQIFIEGIDINGIELYDMQGRMVHTEKGNIRNIDVSGFVSGNYLITISTENGQKITRQITINR